MTIPRPAASEYPPHFEDYVSRVPPGDVLERLQGQLEELLTLLGRLSDEEAGFRYAPDKWSIKQIIGHLSDTERIMSYRGLCAARSETTGLPSFDENAYVTAASFDARPLADLLAELARCARQRSGCSGGSPRRSCSDAAQRVAASIPPVQWRI